MSAATIDPAGTGLVLVDRGLAGLQLFADGSNCTTR
jgi:hypothetical protein